MVPFFVCRSFCTFNQILNMKRSYWETMAPNYDDEIFDVLQNDKKALIRQAIAEYASPKKTVMDIGCAIGKWLPVLAPAFKKVIAVDISAENLKLAAARYPQYTNVDYRRADMSARNPVLLPCDFAICINAILTADEKDRNRFFANLGKCVKKGGGIVLTIPSLESHLLASIVQHRYKADRALLPPETNGKAAIRKWNNIRQGNADIDGVPHKHYLADELRLLLREAGFRTLRIEKIEYDWTTEFNKPPKGLTEPKPWDWMVVAERV